MHAFTKRAHIINSTAKSNNKAMPRSQKRIHILININAIISARETSRVQLESDQK